jgi:hypothetical protein
MAVLFPSSRARHGIGHMVLPSWPGPAGSGHLVCPLCPLLIPRWARSHTSTTTALFAEQKDPAFHAKPKVPVEGTFHGSSRVTGAQRDARCQC